MAARTPSPAVSGLGLIVLCFVGSAALRLTENGVAFAEELSAAAGDATAADDGCSGNADALMESIRQREGELDSERKRLADRRKLRRAHPLSKQCNRLAQHRRCLLRRLAFGKACNRLREYAVPHLGRPQMKQVKAGTFEQNRRR